MTREEQNKIDKHIPSRGQCTTRKAVVLTFVYAWLSLVCICKDINRAVHRLPWLFIILTVAAATIISYINIAQARAERDSYNQKNAHLIMQLDSYKAVFDKKEAR